MTVFDIYGFKENGEMKFKFPFYKFGWNEEIAVSRLVIEWKSSKDKVFGIIKTNLVDLNGYNLKQQFFAFTKLERTAISDIHVPNPVFYPVQIHELQDATISMLSMFEGDLAEIKNVYLQFITK